MAINTPGDWTHLTKAELVGYVPAGIEPVNTLAQRTHYMYRHHSPAVFTGVVWSVAATTQEVYFPISPSADGLSYDTQIHLSYSANDTYAARLYYTTGSATNGATWVEIGTSLLALTGSPNVSTLTPSGTVPASAKFLRVVTGSAGSSNHQITGITVYPGTATPAATQDSGFVAFDDGFLTTGAPIHTEYLNRCAANAEAVYKDRKWCVWSFVQTADTPLRLSCAVAGAYRTLGLAACSMPDDLLSRTATVKVRADDSAGSNGYVEVFQVNGQSTGATLTADNTDRSTTITLTGSDPVIGARFVANGGMAVYYVTVEIAPTLEKAGTKKDLITSAAPPARSEYLTTIDSIQTRLFWQTYPVAGVVMDPTYYTANHVLLSLRVGPGVRRFRSAITRFISGDGADTVVGLASFKNTDSGANAQDTIQMQSDIQGKTEKHPLQGTNDAEKIHPGVVEYGSLLDMPTVDASVWPSGVNRLAEITEDDEPQNEVFYAFLNVYGFGGRYLLTADITTL